MKVLYRRKNSIKTHSCRCWCRSRESNPIGEHWHLPTSRTATTDDDASDSNILLLCACFEPYRPIQSPVRNEVPPSPTKSSRISIITGNVRNGYCTDPYTEQHGSSSGERVTTLQIWAGLPGQPKLGRSTKKAFPRPHHPFSTGLVAALLTRLGKAPRSLRYWGGRLLYSTSSGGLSALLRKYLHFNRGAWPLERALLTVGFPNIDRKPQDSTDITVGGAGYEVKARPAVNLGPLRLELRTIRTSYSDTESRLLTHGKLSYVY
jgi:hypothetical protein